MSLPFSPSGGPQDENCRYMAALCMHARGQVEEATRCYDALLSLKPGHQAWYTRECCVYLWSNIRRPWRGFSADAELDPEFKVREVGAGRRRRRGRGRREAGGSCVMGLGADGRA